MLSFPYQLLAALKQPAGGPPLPPSHAAPPAVVPPVMPPVPVLQQTPPNSYYSSAPASAHYPTDPSNPYNAGPAPTISPAAAAVPPVAPSLNNPALAGLPPNILAMLQSSQGQQQLPRPPSTSALSTYGIPPAPPSAGLAAAPPVTANPQYQQLMAYLVSSIHHKLILLLIDLQQSQATQTAGKQ